MPARSTLGDHSATLPRSASTCVTPKALALRRMLPTLPASCRRSSTTVGACGSIAGLAGTATRNPMGAGDSSPLKALNTGSASTATCGAHSASSRSRASPAQALSAISACSAGRPRARSALQRWSPSSQASPPRR